MSGYFITFEGPEKSGKSTQAKLLKKYLTKKGFSCLFIREPGSTTLSEKIRKILLDKRNIGISHLAEMLLYMTARSQLIKEVIEPALKKNKVVICDRFLDSTIAYQGYGLGLDLQVLRVITAFATDSLVPDLTICLDVPVEVGLARKRGQSPEEWNRMEQKELEYFERVRAGYLELAGAEPRRWRVLDATLPFDDVQALVRQEIGPLLSKGARTDESHHRESEEES